MGRLSSAERRLEQALTRLARVFGPDQVAALVEYEDALAERRDGSGSEAALGTSKQAVQQRWPRGAST
jgi:hypothetical protein